jgi:MFS family permease
MTAAENPQSDRRAAACLGIVQFFFVTTWTVYVIYLPKLLTAAGLAPTITPWILIFDQLVFMVMDVVMGFAADRMGKALGRIGPAIAAITAISCLAFLLMPHASALGMGAAPLLLLIVIWTATSSALRAPLWVMTSRRTSLSNLRWMNVLGLTGIALGGALAPYLGVVLKDVSPSLPFALSSLTLLAATVGAILIERNFAHGQTGAAPDASPPAALPAGLRLFLVGFFLFALGFQIHSALNSGPQYLRFAAQEQLAYLLPVFWIGFNLAMFPGAYWAARVGELKVMAAAAALGALGALTSSQASSLDMLVAGQLIAGGAWGCAFMAGLSAAISFGRTGREGAVLGLLFAALALATMIRILTAAQKWDKAPDLAGLFGWAPTTLWAASFVVFVLHIVMRRRRES